VNARRRARALVTAKLVDRGLPAEFAIGRCVEVWASVVPESQDGEFPRIPLSCLDRFHKGFEAYAVSLGVARARDLEHRPESFGPYSVEHRAANGSAEHCWLTAAGVTRAEIPALRAAALEWLGEVSG